MEQLLFRLTKITTKNEKSPVWGYVPVSAQVLHRFSKKEKKKKKEPSVDFKRNRDSYHF